MDVFFSIIIPLYNKELYIERSISSVLNQTFKNFELIVVDDGSTDNGPNIVKNILDKRIYLIQQENKGVSSARNKGIDASKYEFIAFLDADDEWKPEFLETILKLVNKYPDAGAYATAYCSDNGKNISTEFNISFTNTYDKEYLINNYFKISSEGRPLLCSSSSVMVPKKTIVAVGNFSTDAWWGEDLDMWGRIALKYPIAFSPVPCAIYHVDASNRACKRNKCVKTHPFVKTARMAINDKQVSSKKYIVPNGYYIC